MNKDEAIPGTVVACVNCGTCGRILADNGRLTAGPGLFEGQWMVPVSWGWSTRYVDIKDLIAWGAKQPEGESGAND